MESTGNHWSPMASTGVQWSTVETNGIQWSPVKSNGDQWWLHVEPPATSLKLNGNSIYKQLFRPIPKQDRPISLAYTTPKTILPQREMPASVRAKKVGGKVSQSLHGPSLSSAAWATRARKEINIYNPLQHFLFILLMNPARPQ